MKMWVVDIRKVCAFLCAVLLPNMALAVTCPSGFSEFLIDDAHVVVPLSERCPDGYSQIYTVDDCADANTGSVCAVCDSDSILGSFANCVELCSADKKTIRFSNDLSFNLLKSPGTKPALNILTANNQQCYVDLAAGNAPGLNFQLPSGATYHAVQHGGGYRVCAPGYTLSYDCGIGGGVPPESQSLLSGYWYTVPASAGSCRVPDGMRFTGWEIDGIKHSPYTIYTYDFDTNKTLTAMFGDASKVNVNYFCETTNSSPVYTDIVMLGEGVAPKTNMCPYEPKETEPLAWIEPFSQEEINLLMTLVDGEQNLSEGTFLKSYFGMGVSVVQSELEELVWLLLIVNHLSCINDPETQADNPEGCMISKLFYEHTYFDPVAFAGEDAEIVAVLHRDVYPEEDVNLSPLYLPRLYEMTWNCGKHFRVSGGLDFNGSTRYGWTVRYGCSAPGRGGYDYSPAYGMTFVGWDVDGVLYEGTDLTYKWTEDKTATGIFDYNLNADFDCGAYGTLTSGDATLTYSGRGAGDMYVPLNINAQCTANIGKKFVGWQIDGADTVYNVGDTLNWVDSIVSANSDCYLYYEQCDELIFTAVYEDVPAGTVNYYCSVNDSVPAFSEQLIVGNSVDVKTNMCPYDTKKTEPLAWVVPFTQDEINQIIALGESGLNLSMMESFLMPYFGQDGGILDSELSELLFSMLLQYYAQCGNNTDATCTLSRLIYEHTYLDPNAWASDPFDEMYSWFRDIYSDTDLNLLPLYHAAGYDINFDCGKYFRPAAGDLNDIAWTARYGWDKTYYCADLSGRDYSFYVEECVGFSEGGECLQSTTAIDMVGWQIDGSEYEQTFKYIWTTDQNAVAVFDYDLSATFDCGADGALAYGIENVTYTGRNVGTDEISLNIDATCASNANRTFVGWKLVNNDTQYQVGDTLNWLDVFLDANNCISSSCKKLTFEAVYEFVDGIKYYCEYNAPADQYDHLQKFYGDPITVLEPQCESPYTGATHMLWYTPFSDDEIAQLNAILPYDDLSAESQKFVAPFMSYTDVVDANVYLFMFGLSVETLISESVEYNTLFIDLVKQHLYGTDFNTEITSLTSLYALYLYIPLEPKYNTGNVSVFNRGVDGMFSFLEWPYYGQEYPLQKFSPVTCNSDIDIVGYEHDGNVYGTDEIIAWLYTDSVEFNVLFDLDITARFDCGADGVLQNTNMAEKTYSADGVTGDMALDLTLDAVCVPNSGKKFVGWKLSDSYAYTGSVGTVGTVLNLWDELHNRNPNLGLLDDARHCPSGYDNGLFEFTAVYEDVIDVNYYCSVSDSLPTYTNQYSANSTGAPLRQSGCNNDTSRYELFGWYTPFTAEETAKLKSYSFDTKYPEYWAVVEPLFISQTSDYALDRNVLFILAGMWSRGSGSSSDAGVNYLIELLQKHWFIKGYSSVINLSGSIDLYAFYTGKYYGVNFDCGMGQYELWDDFNTGYYGATQKWCDSCNIGDYTSSGWSFAGWEVDGVFHEMCEPFVWEWTQNKTAIGVYNYDMTANFDCGADGTLSGGSATIENKTRGNGTDAIPLNITAKCAPNAGKRFVGWSNNGSVYNVGQTLNWLDYVGESVVDFVAVYEDVIDVNYYCSAVDVSPTYTDAYPIGTTSVELRSSGCDYDAQQFNFRGWYTPFTADEVATLKSYSFDTKFPEYWAVIEPTFVNHTSSYTYDYETVFMLTGLYGGYGVDGNDKSVKYLTELLQKHWFLVEDSLSMTVSDSANDVYAFFVEVD